MRTRMIGLLLSVSAVGLVVAGLQAEEEDTTAAGEKLFGKYKCATCHSVEAAGIERKGDEDEDEEGPDLSGAGLEHEAEWMAKYLLKKEKLNDEKHEKKFRGKEEELETLTAWLATMEVDSLGLVKMREAKKKAE